MHYKYEGWTLAVLIAFDQLGNAVGGGNPDSTISARVGHFADDRFRSPSRSKRAYWRTLEWIIDLAFEPIDGKGHCKNAAAADPDGRYERGNDITQFVLSMIILTVCPFIAIVLWPLSLVIPFRENE